MVTHNNLTRPKGKTSGPTLNFQKSHDLVTKNPKIEQKFLRYTENTRKRLK